jgi:hypothetical protein
MVADIAIHQLSASDGLDQPHAHIPLTLRRLEEEKFTDVEKSWNRLVRT